MVNRRVWWGTGAIIVGLGAALLTGTGIAAADDGDSERPNTSQQADESAVGVEGNNSSSKPTSKGGVASAATLSGARTGEPASADRVKSASATEDTTTVGASASDAEMPALSAEPVRARHVGPKRVTVAATAVLAETAAAPPPADESSTPPATVTTDQAMVKPSAATEETTVSATAPEAEGPTASPDPAPARHAESDDASVAETAVSEATAATSPPTDQSSATTATAKPAAATDVIQLAADPRSPAKPAANAPPAPGPVATLVLNLLSALGWTPRPEAVAAFPALATWVVPSSMGATGAFLSPLSDPANPPLTTASTGQVTGVRVGRSYLVIPCGPASYTTPADWYFPTRADGTVEAKGVIWLQHGFLGDKSWYSALATTLAQRTNSIVVAPNLSSFPLACAGCWLNGVPMQRAVASMFLGNRAALNISADAAGYQGTLPEDFLLTGHSAGGGFATAVAGYYAADNANDGSLRGVVMFDGFSFSGTLPNALQSLNSPYIPVYQVAAPPQLWNLFGATTDELVAARPGQFVGVVLARGSHVDSLVGGNPIIDFFAQLVAGFSPPGNTAAVYTLATGWINDLYAGLGPTDGYGIYGAPDQYILVGHTAAVVLGPAPVIDVNQYLGTWYEVGSVKQFFSIGLVNTKAVYSLNPDGSIKVENSGNYFIKNGPQSTIVGSAVPVDPANNKLNVNFFSPASVAPPGNYWIVDLAPDYSWAIVSDPTGLSGFLLTRDQFIAEQLYQELLDRASVNGVKGWITRTRQYSATAITPVPALAVV